MTPVEGRRDSDNRLARVILDVADLKGDLADVKKEMQENTQITKEVRDVLATFRVIAAVAKWITITLGAIGVAFAAFKFGVTWVNHK